MESQTNYAEYLEHHGVKGMRWGVRRTPAQLGHEPSKRKKSADKTPDKTRPSIFFKKASGSAQKEKKIAKKEKRKQEVDEKKAAKRAQKDIARREKILQDPTLLYKHRKEFSPDEIRKAMSNIQMEQNLQQLSMNRLSVGQQYLQTAVKYADTGIKAYNNAAKIYNAFGKGSKPMPIIGGGEKKKKKKDDDD